MDPLHSPYGYREHVFILYTLVSFYFVDLWNIGLIISFVINKYNETRFPIYCSPMMPATQKLIVIVFGMYDGQRKDRKDLTKFLEQNMLG